jgi:signal peptidase II
MTANDARPLPFGRLSSTLTFLVVALTALAADLGTKRWATAHLDGARGLTSFLSLVYRENRGIAGSLLEHWPDPVKLPLLAVATAAAIFALVFVYARNPTSLAVRFGAPLVVGGALGNFVERMRAHYVVDFISLHATLGGRTFEWPVFNVADIAICVGVGLLFLARRPLTSPSQPSPARL